MIEVLRVPVLNDNYVWLLHDDIGKETVVVDPAVSEPVLDAARQRGWSITQIWNTHWHGDHVGGNAAIKAATGCTITGPLVEADKIGTLDCRVGEGDTVRIGDYVADVMSVPAHTSGHIAYYLASESLIFVGDTLFAMGCGRIFEGTAAQMFKNMQRFKALPSDTLVYCAHEYTQSNAHFALKIEPDNIALRQRAAAVDEARSKGEATVPTTIGQEQATNIFMRAADVAELADRRAAKDAA